MGLLRWSFVNKSRYQKRRNSKSINASRFALSIKGLVYEDKEVECDDCEGHGTVDFTYTSIDGESFYTTDTCPVCCGKGSLVKSIEVKTGKKIIPYETSYVDIYFEKYLYNTVNAELLHRIGINI